MKTKKFSTTNNQFGIIITPMVFKELFNKKKIKKEYEVGGAIVGFYELSLKYAIITQILFIKGKQKTHRYNREGKLLTKRLKDVWKYSKGTEYYLGEWHTHPNGKPMFSRLDKNNMIDISKSPVEDCLHPILIIIGNQMQDYNKDLRIFIINDKERLIPVKPHSKYNIIRYIWRRIYDAE